MSGTTLKKAFVPLAGGSTAVYNSSSLAYYRHSDWLGSSRLASTPSASYTYDNNGNMLTKTVSGGFCAAETG